MGRGGVGGKEEGRGHVSGVVGGAVGSDGNREVDEGFLKSTYLLLLNFFCFVLPFYKCIIPIRFLLWEIRIASPLPPPRGKPAATESPYPTYGACWLF